MHEIILKIHVFGLFNDEEAKEMGVDILDHLFQTFNDNASLHSGEVINIKKETT